MCTFTRFLYIIPLLVIALCFSLSIYLHFHTADKCKLKEISSTDCYASDSPSGAEYYVYNIKCTVDIDGVRYDASSTCVDSNDKLCSECKRKYKINSNYLCIKLSNHDHSLQTDGIDKYFIVFVILIVIGCLISILYITFLIITNVDTRKRCHFDIFSDVISSSMSNTKTNDEDEIKNENNVLL